jgi:hypothetical protein
MVWVKIKTALVVLPFLLMKVGSATRFSKENV